MAFNFVHGRYSTAKLAEAFGLGDKPILGIKIEARVNEITRVTIEFCGQSDEIEGACSFFKEYKLVPAEVERPNENTPNSWREKESLLQ